MKVPDPMIMAQLEKEQAEVEKLHQQIAELQKENTEKSSHISQQNEELSKLRDKISQLEAALKAGTVAAVASTADSEVSLLSDHTPSTCTCFCSYRKFSISIDMKVMWLLVGEFAVVVKTAAHTKPMYSTYFQEVEALKKENKEMKKDIKKMLKKLEKVEEKAKSADVGK